MERFPKVFIIILNYNGKDFIKRNLLSVFGIAYPNFKVVLVDNDSADGSLEIAMGEFSKAIIIRNSANLGFSAGNNVGIRYALERGADYVMLLNVDTVVEKNILSDLVWPMEEDQKIGIASPLIREGNSPNIWFSGGKISWLKMKTAHERKERQENYFGSDYISGCAMVVRSEVFKGVGPLDEDYFLYWEDADFSVRARRAGYKLMVNPASRIRHFESSERKKDSKLYWMVFSGLLFFRKNSPFWMRPWIFAYILARKLKNKIDLKLERKIDAKIVSKAYQDFHYAK